MEVEVIGVAPKCREQLAESRSMLFFVVPAIAHDFVNLNCMFIFKENDRKESCLVRTVFRLHKSSALLYPFDDLKLLLSLD